MKKKELINKLKELNLVKDSYVIMGDSALVFYGIKKDCVELTIGINNNVFKKIKDKLIKERENLYKYANIIFVKHEVNQINYINNIPVLTIDDLLENVDSKKIRNLLNEYNRSKDNLSYEKELYEKGYLNIAGVDEVGRGPLVGPVVASAVILPYNYQLKGLTDSKKLTEKQRMYYYNIIKKEALAIGIGIVDEKIIDKINIYEASRLAMQNAIENLNIKPDYILTDAMKLNIDIPFTDIIRGDLLSLSISAASVIAKVTRDEMMNELDKKYPQYGFKNHKGYPTKQHIENLMKYGVLKNYRMSYHPICDIINSAKKEKENV